MIRRLALSAYVCALFLTGQADAEDATVAVSAPVPASETKLKLGVDLRPSLGLTPGATETHMENEIMGGLQITKSIGLTGHYLFTQNINDPSTTDAALTPTPYQGFTRFTVKNIYDDGRGLTVSYENRIYVPVANPGADKAGFATAMRNYVKVSKELSSAVKLTVSELPIVLLHTIPGTEKSGATPIFENRVYAITDIQLSKDLSLSVPVMFHQTKYRPFVAGAKNNDAWGFFLWVYPELSYSVSDNVTLGLAYYSDNLVKPNLSDIDVTGFEKGVIQASLQLSI